MNWTACARQWPWPNLRYHTNMGLEGQREIMTDHSTDSASPGSKD